MLNTACAPVASAISTLVEPVVVPPTFNRSDTSAADGAMSIPSAALPLPTYLPAIVSRSPTTPSRSSIRPVLANVPSPANVTLAGTPPTAAIATTPLLLKVSPAAKVLVPDALNLPELLTTSLPPSSAMAPLITPLLVTIAGPPAVSSAYVVPFTVPELITVTPPAPKA